MRELLGSPEQLEAKQTVESLLHDRAKATEAYERRITYIDRRLRELRQAGEG